MPSSTGGRWKRGGPVGHLRVPGRCAEKRHHDGLVGTQPTDQSLPRQRSTLLEHRMVPTRKNPNRRYPACWPSDKKMAQARSRIRELTGRNRRHVSTAVLVEDLNQYLRGWRQYYRFGNSTHRFAKIDRYVVDRMALLLSKRHGRRGRGYGLKLIILSGDRLGLERLTGTIVYGRTAHAGGEGRRRAG